MNPISKNNGFRYNNVLTCLLVIGIHGYPRYLFAISIANFSALEYRIGRFNVLAGT